MPCSICRKAEKGASEECQYICSWCTATIGSAPKSEIRIIIDKLYLADRANDAQFVEKVITGGNQSSSTEVKMIKRVVPIKRRR